MRCAWRPHLVRLALGGGEDLVPLPLGDRLALRHLALGGGAQLGDVPLGGGALLRDLVVGGGAQLGDLALGGGGQLVRLAPRGGADRVGLALRRAAHVVGLALGVGAQLGGLVLGRGPQLGPVNLGGRLDLVGLGPRGLDQLGGLLLGQPQQLLDARAKPGIGRPFLLLDLPLRVVQVAARGDRVFLVAAHLVGERADVLVDLVRIVAAHHLGEVARRGLFEEAGQLSVNVRLHMGLIQARRGSAGGTGAREMVSPMEGNLLRLRRLCRCFDVLPGGWLRCHLPEDSKGHMALICPCNVRPEGHVSCTSGSTWRCNRSHRPASRRWPARPGLPGGCTSSVRTPPRSPGCRNAIEAPIDPCRGRESISRTPAPPISASAAVTSATAYPT